MPGESSHEASDRCAFAAGNNESVQSLQMPRQTYLGGFHTKALQHSDMFRKIALESKYTYLHSCNSEKQVHKYSQSNVFTCIPVYDIYHPRPAIRSTSGIWETLRPTIGSPRFLLTSARILASW